MNQIIAPGRERTSVSRPLSNHPHPRLIIIIIINRHINTRSQVDSKVAVVSEQWLRLMHHCGLPKTDVDMINCDGCVWQQSRWQKLQIQ